MDALLMTNEHWETLINGLIKLVILAMLIERGLAWLFELKVFRADEGAMGMPSTLKGLIALGLAWVLCSAYDFNLLLALFPKATPAEGGLHVFGVFVTALIVAGGSAGAIALFQGVLGFSKVGRDAMIAARKASAEAAKAEAEAKAAEAQTRRQAALHTLATAPAPPPPAPPVP